MKFLSSTSPAASTTTTTTTNSNSNSYIQKSISSRGVIGILGRLLCFNTLPMHPLDQSREFSKEAKECGVLDYGKKEEVKFEAMGNPGIVGRLMGLDSMPEVGLGGTRTRPNSITRSRLTNYADTWREELEQGKHHRINSTLSFCDAKPFVKQETEEFFILSFEGEGKDNELVLKTRKADKGSGELKQKRRDKCRSKNRRRENRNESTKENLAPNIVPDDVRGSKVQDTSQTLQPTSKLNQNSDVAGEVGKQPKSIGQRQSGERRRSRRKKKENCCENSSPGYILDFSDSPPEPEVPGSEDKRRLSGELESYKHSSPIITSNSTNNGGKADKSNAKHLHSWTNDSEFQNYSEMWEEICKLTKMGMMGSNRMYREPRKLEDFKDIGAAISLEILDQLISEFLEL